MKIFKVGDTQKAVCSNCHSLRTATFKLRDVPFSDGSGVVKNVLVGVCDSCDEVCLLPHQSTPMVHKQLEAQRKSLETRLPAHLLDVLNLAAAEVGGSPEFVSCLMKYYIHKLAASPDIARTLPEKLGNPLALGKADKRLSLKGRRVIEELEVVKQAAHIANTTDVIKCVILIINEEVLLKKAPVQLRELESIVSAVA